MCWEKRFSNVISEKCYRPIMSSTSKKAELLQRVDRFYERHSAQRVALAALLGGVISIFGTFLLYFLTVNFVYTLGFFFIFSMLVLHIAFYVLVAPTKQLTESKELILGALNDPSLIQSAEQKKVVLADAEGKLRELNTLEQHLWSTMIVPYFMKNTASLRSGGGRGGARRMSKSELEQLENRKSRLVEMENSIQEERDRLESERDHLAAQTDELKKAEGLVIERLTSVERSEAELEQLRENLADYATKAGGTPAADTDKREKQLRTKEAELERLKQQLEEDRSIVEQQKTELNQLKGEILSQASSEFDSLDEEGVLSSRMEQLEEKARKLEEAAREVEQRSRYVTEVEDSLVARLNELSEREARIEQGEEEQRNGTR